MRCVAWGELPDALRLLFHEIEVDVARSHNRIAVP